MARKKKFVDDDPKATADQRDAVAEMPAVPAETVFTVKSELDDDMPRLARIRAGEYLPPAAPPCPPERRGSVERVERPTKRKPLDNSRRDHLSKRNWLTDTDPAGVDPITKRAPAPQPPPPSPEDQAAKMRNEWIADKFEEDAQEAEHTRFIFIKPGNANASLRFAFKPAWTPRDLLPLIKDERFCTPVHFVQSEIKIDTVPHAPDEFHCELCDQWLKIPEGSVRHEAPKGSRNAGRVLFTFPDGMPHFLKINKTEKPAAIQTAVPIFAVTEKEIKFYCDYANSNFTVEQLLEKHGVWTDEQIIDLENRILRHAVKVGLVGMPHDTDGWYTEDLSTDAVVAAAGLASHSGKMRLTRSQRWVYEPAGHTKAGSLAGKAPTQTRIRSGDFDSGGAPEHDDYGEESRS